MRVPEVLILVAMLIAWVFWLSRKSSAPSVTKSWVRSPLRYSIKIIITALGTWVAVVAGRILGYPAWAQVAFVVVGAMCFVVQVRSELGRFAQE